MKRSLILLAALFFLICGSLQAQDDFKPKNILKLNGYYLLHSFTGSSVSMIGIGPELELSLNEKTSTSFGLYYMTRVGELTKQPKIYIDVIYFTWGGRWYSTEVLDGFYAGLLIGIGKPTSNSWTGDLGVQAGYQVVDGRFSYEIGLQGGYGFLREQSTYQGEPIYDTQWGFFTRPFVSLGYGF
jgi:hypothetical protein